MIKVSIKKNTMAFKYKGSKWKMKQKYEQNEAAKQHWVTKGWTHIKYQKTFISS